MPESILKQLEEGVVLGDGGYLLALENRGYVQAGPFTPEVTIEHPNALLALHEELVHAGAEVLQVLTFYASENKLAQTGYAGRLEEINRAAVRIAREAGGGRALVAGNICLTWKYPESEDECRRLLRMRGIAHPPDGPRHRQNARRRARMGRGLPETPVGDRSVQRNPGADRCCSRSMKGSRGRIQSRNNKVNRPGGRFPPTPRTSRGIRLLSTPRRQRTRVRGPAPL